MIVVGVDPGARSTGIAVVDLAGDRDRWGQARPTLLASTTVERSGDEPLLEVSPHYLATVVAAVRDAIRVTPDGIESSSVADVVAVERITRPRQHLDGTRARGGRGGAAADPTALLATAVVLGAILGRSWAPADLVVVPNKGNGRGATVAYPPELLDRDHVARPGGKRRHERAAYDVALAAPLSLNLARRRSSAYS